MKEIRAYVRVHMPDKVVRVLEEAGFADTRRRHTHFVLAEGTAIDLMVLTIDEGLTTVAQA